MTELLSIKVKGDEGCFYWCAQLLPELAIKAAKVASKYN